MTLDRTTDKPRSRKKPKKEKKPKTGKTKVKIRSQTKKGRTKTKVSVVLESVSTPKQARSERTLANILEATEKLILERGLQAVSVGDIVREAGSSVGGFYARFRDKGELMVALSERTQQRFQAQVVAILDPQRWAAASLGDIVHVCAQEIVAEMAERRLIQAAILQSVAAEPERWKRGVAFRARMVSGIAALLLTRREEIGHPDPDRATRFAIEAALALMDQRALFGDLQEQWRLDDVTLVAEIERLVLGYLRVDEIR